MPWRGYAEPLSSPPTVPSPPVARRWVRRRATETAAGTASPGGRVLWLLGSRCVAGLENCWDFLIKNRSKNGDQTKSIVWARQGGFSEIMG